MIDVGAAEPRVEESKVEGRKSKVESSWSSPLGGLLDLGAPEPPDPLARAFARSDQVLDSLVPKPASLHDLTFDL
jgi:hypothetical protein